MVYSKQIQAGGKAQ